MNYLQNLYLCDFQQPSNDFTNELRSCELLSKFVPLWFPTTKGYKDLNESLLWITFKICTFVISNNPQHHWWCSGGVVNYFQNLYLCDFQQRRVASWGIPPSCELLSKFVSLWLPTTKMGSYANTLALWITFKICIFVTPNNSYFGGAIELIVVNYFQNLYLCDFQQHHILEVA